MNKLVEKLASPVKAGEENKYAVVLVDNGKYYGLFDISSNDEMQESIIKVATNDDGLPSEVRAMAMGVINTIYMAKTGSEWPLFVGVSQLDTNILDSKDVDWSEVEAADKHAGRDGYLYNGNFLPLDTEANIKAAAELLAEYESRFDGKDRVKFANAIQSCSKKMNVKTDAIVEKYAATTLSPDFYELMDDRIKLAKDYPETQNLLKKIVEDAPAMDVNKVAESLVVVDMMVPFSMKFGTVSSELGSDRPMFYRKVNVPDAYHTVFGVNRRPLKVSEKIAMIDDEKLKSVFSDLFIEKLRKDPDGIVKNASEQVRTILVKMAQAV